MKKKLVSSLLLSGVVLNAAAPAIAQADDFDAQIAAQDAIISNLSDEQVINQSQVASLEAQVSGLEAEQAELTVQNETLEAESKELAQDIQKLSEKIVARNEKLKSQARSLQKNKKLSSYIATILEADSISDAFNRILAIRKVVSANEKLLKQQEEDRSALQAKQEANQEAINTVLANKAALAENTYALATQQAELKVAQLSLSASLASAQEEKASLLTAKAEAEEAARQAAQAQAEAEAKAQAEAEAQAASVLAAQTALAQGQTLAVDETTAQVDTSELSATETLVVAIEPVAEVVAEPVVAVVAQPVVEAVAQPVAQVATATAATASYSANTYPIGQCTWGVKELAPWAGNNWGNGAQWAASAAAAGFAVGTTPVVGAIAVWNDGGYGHVAYVTGVDGDKIQVMEANVNGNQYIANHRGWFNPIGIQGAVSYIYP